MKYEKVKFNVGDEQFDVIHCLGDGQCKCKSCEKKGENYISWTSWFYKLSEEDNVMCSNCLRELLIQRRINEAVKKVLKDIGSIEDGERLQYKVYQWFIDICKKYKIDRNELFPPMRMHKYSCVNCKWNSKPSFECRRYKHCSDCLNYSKQNHKCHCTEQASLDEKICPYYEVEQEEAKE